MDKFIRESKVKGPQIREYFNPLPRTQVSNIAIQQRFLITKDLIRVLHHLHHQLSTQLGSTAHRRNFITMRIHTFVQRPLLQVHLLLPQQQRLQQPLLLVHILPDSIVHQVPHTTIQQVTIALRLRQQLRLLLRVQVVHIQPVSIVVQQRPTTTR